MEALGLVTAAGMSTRMGGFPKPLLRFGEERFVERIVGQYREAGVAECLVVLGHEAEIVRRRADLENATVRINDAYEEGMLSSVQVGVRYADAQDLSGLLLWPVDYPCAPAAVLEALWEAFQASGADVVVPTANADRGHPALFAPSTFDALLSAPETEGARAVVYDDTTVVEEVPTDDPRILVDIDTPSEYWEAIKRYEPGFEVE